MGSEGDRESDRKRRQDQPYRNWYKLASWLRLREAQLKRHPLCEICIAKVPSQVTAADTVHHKRPHKGDRVLFLDPNNLASSCKECHDAAGQFEDHHGYVPDIGADGWPIDGRHPANQ